MSCLGPDYNPNPQRVWSRVQNPCTYNLDPPTAVFVPLTGQTINLVDYPRGKQMLLKGNILQYKKNSSNLTKQQRYSQIAKGLWTNRTKSWASQTQTSTNPNTSSLLRVNYETIPIINQITDPFGCTVDFLKEGGTLVGNTVVNPCTGEVIKKTFVNQCNPSSASDVPGPIIPLCWDSRVETWYPRQNLTMNNSSDKWPVNYKLFKSANALVSGTEVSQNFLYGNIQNQNTNTLNEININNIYFNESSFASVNINSFTAYYNEFMNNDSITQVNNVLKSFFNNQSNKKSIDDPISFAMSVSNYNELVIGLVELKKNVPPGSALYDIITLYTNLLDSLYQSSNLNLSLQGANGLVDEYKNDSIILNDVNRLQQYLTELNNSVNIFGTITVNSIEEPIVKEPYLSYHILHGIPYNLEYDTEKLFLIKESLNL
jgi:hypothetical protein